MNNPSILRVCAFVSALLVVAATATITRAGTIPDHGIRPPWVPSDATAVSDCVEALGYVFWNPKRLPFGPTYGAFDGKPVFEEIMVAQSAFERGLNLDDVAKPVPPAKVDHVDIWFAPHGHPGFMKPHYDIILAFMSHIEHMHLCGNDSAAHPDFVLQSSKR